MADSLNPVCFGPGNIPTVNQQGQKTLNTNWGKCMGNLVTNKVGKRQFIMTAVLAGLVLLSATGCSLVNMLGTGIEPPPASEFGLGPRVSLLGLYKASLLADRPLAPRKMQSLQVLIESSTGAVIDDATISINGGMPQHGHGLPTRPRVTSYAGSGIYQIEGVRFNMGGWWEFKLAIASPAGDDSIVFNLDI